MEYDNDCCCPLFQVDLAHLLAAREQELRTLSAEVYMIKFCPLAFNFLNKQKENSIKAYNITLRIKRTSPTYTILCRIICMGYLIFPRLPCCHCYFYLLLICAVMGGLYFRQYIKSSLLASDDFSS